MKSLVLCMTMVTFLQYSEAQQTSKPILDTSVFGKWPKLGECAISPNGQYAAYGINNLPYKSKTLVIQATEGKWKKEITGKNDRVIFSNDNKQVVFSGADSLHFLSLGSESVHSVPGIASFSSPNQYKGEWLAYQLKGTRKELVLLNLLTGKQQRFSGVSEYRFDNNGKVLLLNLQTPNKDTSFLQWINLATGQKRTIWSSVATKPETTIAKNFTFDDAGVQLAFTVSSQTNTPLSTSLWYYHHRMEKAALLADEQHAIVKAHHFINGTPQFTANGRYLIFELHSRREKQQRIQGLASVDVWHYKDPLIQPDQLARPLINRYYACLNILDNQLVLLTKAADETIVTNARNITGDHLVIQCNSYVETYLPNNLPSDYWIVSLKNGNRKLITQESARLFYFSFSPKGQYLAFWNFDKSSYNCFDTQSATISNLTTSLPGRFALTYVQNENPYPLSTIPIWNSDSTFITYDNHDIWQLNAINASASINLTAGKGRKKEIRLRLLYDPLEKISFDKKRYWLLSAFDDNTKYNGFYKFNTSDGHFSLDSLSMGPYIYYYDDSQSDREGSGGMRPLQASQGNAWLVRRESDQEMPNYYFTKDFKTFQALSQLAPQKKYNWIYTQLMTWRMLDGKTGQGVLYKPENFDSAKKYPVIFNYYEKKTHEAYKFHYPKPTSDEINIPWFVSQGYLLFTPDIYFTIAGRSGGRTTGESSYNSVISAAAHLSTLPYVDSAHLGLQGHSFGGGQTSYLVTHSNIFAAACEMAGTVDNIASYLSIVPAFAPFEHFTKIEVMEVGPGRMGKGITPWTDQDIYLRNSPILNADQVTTPLLIMHNKTDNSINWYQGVEMYLAMRRLGKKAWMLQYDNSGHSLLGNDAMDFSIRLMQFFDFYLKGAQPPLWMTRGIPANQKGLESGLDLDTTHSIP